LIISEVLTKLLCGSGKKQELETYLISSTLYHLQLAPRGFFP